MGSPQFDASEPPDGDFARYVERLVDQSALSRAPAASGQPGASGRPGAFGRLTRHGRPVEPPRATLPGPTPSPDVPEGRARSSLLTRVIERLTLAMIGGGAALIALTVLQPAPWIDTPLPGFLLLVTGLVLRQRLDRQRTPPPTR